MSIYETANQLINDAAIELGVGTTEQADIFSSTDLGYAQLISLSNACGRELLRMAIWAELVKEHTIVTDIAGSADFPLPEDWGYMIPQTHWNQTDYLPLLGPLSAQGWQYLEGRGLVSQTLYASFRIKTGFVSIFPNNPPPDNKTLKFEYVRNTWCSDDAAGTTWYDRLQDSTTVVRYPPVLFVKFLKTKFLEAKGFDSTKARDDFNSMYDSVFGQDKSAPVLNAGSVRGQYPYLDMRANVSDTNFGA